jgi:serine/threonine-protein kinase
MQVAWPFTRLNPGDVEDFIDRWGGWLGSAAQGSLSYPMRLPEGNPSGSWRR